MYGNLAAFRNYLYDKKYLKAVRYDVPTIAIGNLTVGGTGKSMMVEHLIELLQYRYRIATLSRGYGRTSHGFVLADAFSSAAQIGDEPRLFKWKYPETAVAVGEDRVLAVPKLLDAHPETDVILLDDVFQHRAIRAGLNILLTTHDNLFTRDYPLPLGWLREKASGYKRADIIVVSKCPPDLRLNERERIRQELKLFPYQRLFFSALQYGTLYSLYDPRLKFELPMGADVLLVTGIANPKPLKQFLNKTVRKVFMRTYKDHHRYDTFDLETIRDTFQNIDSRNKLIITTEKDATRLEPHKAWLMANKIPIWVQPVRMQFLDENQQGFAQSIELYMEHTLKAYQGNE